MYDIIDEIKTKSERSNVAVFKIDGKAKIIPTTSTKRFNAMMVDYGRYLVGVYNRNCPVEWLKEDLK